MISYIRKYVREIIFEEIGRNYHTVYTQPNTWDSFQDFEINYYPQKSGDYLIDISFKGNKIVTSARFGSQEEARQYARTVVDKLRVEYMNATSKDVR